VLHQFFFQMDRLTLRATGTIVHRFIRKYELCHRGILLDIRMSIRDTVCTHKETNDGRGREGEGV